MGQRATQLETCPVCRSTGPSFSLLKLLQLSGKYNVVRLADALPAVPEKVMSEAEFNNQLQKIQVQVNALRRDRHRSAAQLAYQAYLGSHAVAAITQNEVLKLRDSMTEETQLHYNGMLKSTWELSVNAKSGRRTDLISAQRDLALHRATPKCS